MTVGTGMIGLNGTLSVNDGASNAQQLFANLMDVNWPSGEQEVVESTFMGQGDSNRRYVAGLVAPSDLTFTLQFTHQDWTRLVALRGANKIYVYTAPDGSTFTSNGLLLGYPSKASAGDIITLDATVRLTGAQTYVGGS